MKVGVFSGGLIGGGNSYGLEFNPDAVDNDYCFVKRIELVSVIINHDLLKICRKIGAAYFNNDFRRGWGCDSELAYVSMKYNYACVIDRKIPIEWKTNIGYKKNVGGEILSEYHRTASLEMLKSLVNKYGYKWENLFEINYNDYLYKNNIIKDNSVYCSHDKKSNSLIKGIKILMRYNVLKLSVKKGIITKAIKHFTF